MHLALKLALGLAALGLAAPVSAFCGFYVSGADAKLFNDATQVVLMREGTRTVLSMQNNYKGPAEDFALVIPVPVVLQKDNVKTLPKAIFDKVDQMASPRLVEYWEQDPCNPHTWDRRDRVRRTSKSKSSRKKNGGGGPLVKVEAQFKVGEYEIVILSAKDATALDAWLRDHKYNIPAGAGDVLRPYVQKGTKFFVAKVDVEKVEMKDGQALLSPLRFYYDSDTFELPIRLGLLNAQGAQDLIVHILARGQRYEVANYDNVTIPTNINVDDAVRERFGEFYAALFDATLEEHPKAVVTEYSWDAATCDPCPGPTLAGGDFLTLGADVLPEGARWGFVLTRLHARYTKESLGEDLVFKAASPIVGGREHLVTEGKLEEGARPGGRNNFQGRYIIRHEWTGKIACDKPQRGVWGGPPGGGKSPRTSAATRVSSAPRGKLKLRKVVKQDIPEIGLRGVGGGGSGEGKGAPDKAAPDKAAPETKAPTEEAPEPKTAPEAADKPVKIGDIPKPEPKKKDEGGCTGAGGAGGGLTLALLALAALALARRRPGVMAALLAAAGLAGAPSAQAFCGFYVSGADAKLFNDATQVVLMREGTKTVLSMQNNYKGPPEAFALVIPVPVVLQKDNVKTLTNEVFDKVDKMASPRLVEYWEIDPCWVQPPVKYRKFDDAIPAAPTGSADGKVTVEAAFKVGEYDIVILGATEATALDKWLRDNKYNIPAGAEEVLRPYVQSGTKFFVAKVDVSKVKFQGGEALLSPLRFHYDSEAFSLPIRLGLLNAKGAQDLIVHVLARGQRYELANYKNVTIPTNINVDNEVRTRFGEFYAALFDATLEENPGAVVTEYSWDASTCDPCPGPTLDQSDFKALGADVLAGDPWGFVLTRLHARYTKDNLGEDLVFKAAPPIVGGREHVVGEGGKLEEGSQPGSRNNFQGRYIIRHAWEGEISCDNPVRGRWGGPPGSRPGSKPGIKPAQKLASAPRGRIKLASAVLQDVPEIKLVSARTGKGESERAKDPAEGATKKPETGEDKAQPGPADKATDQPGKTAAKPRSGDSGGCTGATPTSGGSAALVLLAAALLATRRRLT